MAARRSFFPGVLVLVASLAVSAAAPAATGYRDRVGDVKGGTGPDIAAVTLSSTASTITFRIRFATEPPLRIGTRDRWTDMLLIGIDVPPFGPKPVSPGGEWAGADFWLGCHGPAKTGKLVHLEAGRSGPVTTFAIGTRGRTLSFSIPRRALGSPTRIAFAVAAARETANGAAGGSVDVAPERGTYRYALS